MAFSRRRSVDPAGFIEGAGIHEKVAVDAELVAVAKGNRGLKLYQQRTYSCWPPFLKTDATQLIWLAID